ncbi:MAG: hypothetical protein ACQEXJ_06770 [Myxococcota bacterium]
MARDRRIDDLLRDARVRWVSLSALEGSQELACIDGRHSHGVLGAPGGDAGELVLLLAAAEALRGRPLSSDDVQALVDDHLERRGAFYLHTDRDALERLGRALREDDALRCEVDEVGAPESFVRQPPNHCRVPLLVHLVRPEHIGCGHLRAMAEAPEAYGVRLGLLEDLLRAIFVRLWEGQPDVRFVVLEGVHEEEAVVVVDEDESAEPETAAPVLEPGEGAPSVFMLHRPAVRHVRDVGARWLPDVLRRLHPGERLDAEALRGRVDDLGARQIEATVSRLAAHLPQVVLRYGDLRRASC